MAIVPVKVGNGKEIHAGKVVDTVKKGRFEYEAYAHLCGSGNSSFAHNFHKASVKKMPDGTIITCKKCLAMME